MKKNILKILGIIIFQSITISNVFAVLSPEIKTRYFMMSLNNKILLMQTILLIITKIKKKKINFRIIIPIYLIWIIYTAITMYIENYIGYRTTNIWIVLYIITVLIGLIMIVYTLKKIFERR